MPLKFIEFSESGTHISIHRGRLKVRKGEHDNYIPLDIIDGVMFSGYGQNISTYVFEKLLANKAVIVFCNREQLPASILLPYSSNIKLKKIFNAQIEATQVFKKNIWKKVTEYKIYNQSKVLSVVNKNGSILDHFYKAIKSGDKDNREAQAARVYWPQLFGDNYIRSFESNLNGILNYSYTVLRAITARQLVQAGLAPLLSIKHENQANHFPLVDDLMEPFRPLFDLFVYKYWKEYDMDTEVNPHFKKTLFGFINIICPCRDEIQLYTLINNFCISYVNSLLTKKYREITLEKINWIKYAKRISNYVVTSNI